ncbi:hypothetical protein IP69_19635 [Bosea sp. AAP35]|uniref:hypothetical protein n=1 Tax=Bosea sp. AAP35 TaxID=1523417 RepID=UPI0006B91C70|nr:hypothetical protein [Bosea sp. AAP35]KPF62969.1 hypothetical protein IP69_19635 [Bosea sp. AAP35]
MLIIRNHVIQLSKAPQLKPEENIAESASAAENISHDAGFETICAGMIIDRVGGIGQGRCQVPIFDPVDRWSYSS